MTSKRPPKSAEIFISHSSKNRAFVERLVKVLDSHGLKTFYSRKSIRGAQQWHDEIGAALARCSWFALILTPESVKSEWVKHEFVHVLQQRRYRGRIVPVLYRACDMNKLSWTLSAYQYIDFRKKFNDGCRELLKQWKIEYQP